MSVIGWFCKRDTAVYDIYESYWNFNNTDTIQTGSALTRVMLTVTDSTATGYKFNYTFLDASFDSIPDKEGDDIGATFKNLISSSLSDKIIGTTISFETNIYGEIVKFNNLDEIKKQTNTLFNETIDELEKHPWAKMLKDNGIRLKDLSKNIDTGLLVEGYLTDIKLLFLNFGNVYDLGETSFTEEATDEHLANESYHYTEIDDDGCYRIETDVVNTIPQATLRTYVSGAIDNISEPDVVDVLNSYLNISINEDGIIDSYIRTVLLPNGWPYEVVTQDATMIGDKGKGKQKRICLGHNSFCR